MTFYTKFQGISIKTDYPVAYDSPDHQHPCGTAKDNSVNLLFNKHLFQLFKTNGVGLKVLDLGCAGGGFVQSCLNQGCIAVGIEGSDYSVKFQRAHWPFLYNKFLFTADITKPFQLDFILDGEKQPILFDVITIWEVFEHIQENDLPHLLENIRKHLSPHGLLIGSIASFDCFVDGVNLHQTVKPKKWWEELFHNQSFTVMKDYDKYFGDNYVRGKPDGSFNIVLALDPKKAPVCPKIKKVRLQNKVREKWKRSKLLRSLQKWLLPTTLLH